MERKPISESQKYFLKQAGYEDEVLANMSAGEAYKAIAQIKKGNAGQANPTTVEGSVSQKGMGGAPNQASSNASLPVYDYKKALEEALKLTDNTSPAIRAEIVVELLEEMHNTFITDRIQSYKERNRERY